MRRLPFAVIVIAAGSLPACAEHGELILGDGAVDPVEDPAPDPGPDADADPDPDPVPDPVPDPDPVCGDRVVEGDEACDGDNVPCSWADPAYVTGWATCLVDCSGFDESACVTAGMMQPFITRASEITGEALLVVMGLDLVGMYEWEVKEVIDASFLDGGADAVPAFAHIVASGPSALELHYAGGARQIRDGDLLLVDIGARYGGYCGDITRTIPASGTFTDRQRELYQLVLDTRDAAAAAWRPGVHSLEDMTLLAAEHMRASPLRARDDYGMEQTMDVFFIHGLSHYIGVDVHGGDLTLDPTAPAEVGHIFTIEPGLYIPSEGTGIRIEDVYVLTPTGAVNLVPATPSTVEDIEAAMADGSGILPDIALEIPATSPYMAGGMTDHMDFAPAPRSPGETPGP